MKKNYHTTTSTKKKKKIIIKIVQIYLALSLVLWAVWGYFQGGSLCFTFFCLLVSSVPDFHPDTRGRWWTLF